jgi:glycosyltransferase involved in cell wall biosynthesis
MSRFHTIYRSAPGENKKDRPSFYSKDLALSSFLAAMGEAPPGERIFVNDGELPDRRAAAIREGGKVVLLPGVGNCRSYRACVGIVETTDWADDDLVYLAEDDYLYRPGALTALAEAANELPDVDYFSLYDHPDLYRLARHRRFMARRRDRALVGDVQWRRVRSTCLTYAARVGALREDSWVHYMCSRPGDVPFDDDLWAILTGAWASHVVPRLLKVGGRPRIAALANRWLRPERRPKVRLLYVSRPSLATHLAAGQLGRGTDWSTISESLRSSAIEPGDRRG